MRLLYIADANSIHTQRWVGPLVSRGEEVHIVAYKPVQRAWPGAAVIDLTRLYNVPKVRFLVWGMWLRHYVRQVRPDIMHAHQIQAAGWLGFMAHYHPFVISAWGSDLLIEPHRSPLRRTLLQMVLRRCDRLTVPSTLLYRTARELGVPEHKLALIPWGIDTNVFRPEPDDRTATRQELGIPSDAPVVFCPRAVAPVYNLNVVVTAIQLAKAARPDVRLLLLRYNAEPAYLTRLQEQIEAAGIAPQVLWLPPQPDPAAMARLYRMADVMVSVPSLEGYGLSVYEAMACGCPTVVSDLPLFADALSDGVQTLKAPVGDAAATAASLQRVLQDVALAAKLRQAGLETVQQHSVAYRVVETVRLYDQVRALRKETRT